LQPEFHKYRAVNSHLHPFARNKEAGWIMPQATRQESYFRSLRQEREENAVPWSRSPFAHSLDVVVSQPGEEPEELLPGELRVKAPEEVPWIGKPLTFRILERSTHVLYEIFSWKLL
jgi:hypothetical protein